MAIPTRTLSSQPSTWAQRGRVSLRARGERVGCVHIALTHTPTPPPAGCTVTIPTPDTLLDPALAEASNRLFFIKPHGGANASDKAETALLLKADDNSLVEFGEPALQKLRLLRDVEEYQ